MMEPLWPLKFTLGLLGVVVIVTFLLYLANRPKPPPS